MNLGVYVERVIFPDLTVNTLISLDENAKEGDYHQFKTRYEHNLVTVESEYNVFPKSHDSYMYLAEYFGLTSTNSARLKDLVSMLTEKFGKTNVLMCSVESLKNQNKMILTN